MGQSDKAKAYKTKQEKGSQGQFTTLRRIMDWNREWLNGFGSNPVLQHTVKILVPKFEFSRKIIISTKIILISCLREERGVNKLRSLWSGLGRINTPPSSKTPVVVVALEYFSLY